MLLSTAAFWKNGFPCSPRDIGRAAVSISTGSPRVSAHRRSNSSPIPSGSSTTSIGPRVIVGLPFICWRNRSPLQGGWHCRLSWNRRDCRHGAMDEGRRHREEGCPQNRRLRLEPREFGRPKRWYRDVSDPDRKAEVSWLRENVMGPDQAVWALRITARDRYSDRCWGWGEPLGIAMKGGADRVGRRWAGAMTPDGVREERNNTIV